VEHYLLTRAEQQCDFRRRTAIDVSPRRSARLRERQTRPVQSVLHDHVQRLRTLLADGAHGDEVFPRQVAAARTGAVRQRHVQGPLVEHVAGLPARVRTGGGRQRDRSRQTRPRTHSMFL